MSELKAEGIRCEGRELKIIFSRRPTREECAAIYDFLQFWQPRPPLTKRRELRSTGRDE